MKTENLLTKISEMSYKDLLKKIENIRGARVDARAAAEMKSVRKSRPKKDEAQKLFEKMSSEERAKMMELLK